MAQPGGKVWRQLGRTVRFERYAASVDAARPRSGRTASVDLPLGKVGDVVAEAKSSPRLTLEVVGAPIPSTATAPDVTGTIRVAPRPVVDLELILPVANAEESIGLALDELRSFLANHVTSSAIVVVDSGSVDRTGDVIAELANRPGPRVHLVSSSGRGPEPGMRESTLSSRARYVGFVGLDVPLALPELLNGWGLLRRREVAVVVASQRTHSPRRWTVALEPCGWSSIRLSKHLVMPMAPRGCTFKLFDGDLARYLLSSAAAQREADLLPTHMATDVQVAEIPVSRVHGQHLASRAQDWTSRPSELHSVPSKPERHSTAVRALLAQLDRLT